MLWVILCTLIAFVTVLAARTAAFRPKPLAPVTATEEAVDADKVTEAMRAMIRCKTVSDRDPAKEDDAEFEAFISLMSKLFPHVAAE